MNHFQTPASALQERASSATRPFIARAAGAPFLQGPGEQITFLVSTEKTGGALAAGHAIVDVNAGPPLHIHADAEELFIIQSGAFELLVNGELIEARAGDVAYLARGEAHRFRGLDSGEENRFNILIAPGDFEHFMTRWVTLFENGAPDMEQAIALTGEYNISLFPSDAAAPPVPSQPQTKIISKASAPQSLHVLGTQVTVLLSSADTQGRYSLIRVEGSRDAGPPPHLHEREDELFIIEAGEVEILIGDETVIARPGDMVWAPCGFLHTFRIHSAEARMIAFITPGGFESFFEECALLQLAGEASPDKVIELNANLGVTFPTLSSKAKEN